MAPYGLCLCFMAFDQQLLEELGWRVDREREAQEFVRSAKREADRKAHLENIRDTVSSLQSSRIRCSCHDFLHWRDLWLADGQMAWNTFLHVSQVIVSVAGVSFFSQDEHSPEAFSINCAIVYQHKYFLIRN